MATQVAPQPPIALTAAQIEHLSSLVGPGGAVTDPAAMAPYLEERRGLFTSHASAVIRPASADEVCAVVAYCAAEGVPMVPQGGNTGLVGGSVANGGVLLNLGRMNRVREIDVRNDTLTAEAGCVLANLQREADEHDRLFPLSLGAEGSCQIGGNLATNAGGTSALRYGMARDLTLGLEVVLPDGRLWDGLRRLRKDNAGYDLKQLFIGSEGTLGVITAAVLKLYPKPVEYHTAFVAVDDLDAVVELLARARAVNADALSAVELMSRRCLEFAVRHIGAATDPIAGAHDWYLLIEFSSSRTGSGLGQALDGLLGAALDDGLIADAALAQSEAQRQNLWFLREAIVEAQRYEGASIKNDVSVPVSQVPEFIRSASAAVETLCPGIRPCAFGHAGDGNIHFNLSQPQAMDGEAFLARWGDLAGRVNEIVHGLNGSFSAEHGIGALKRGELKRFRPGIERELMQLLKAALDPSGIMNPGKIL